VGPELKRYGPQDEREEDEHQGQIEAAEDRGVGVGKRREKGAAAGEKPDLISVPERADGPDQGCFLIFVLGQEGKEDTDAEVEAVQDGISGQEEADQDKPDVAKEVPGFHQ
jgi:hypothetical protein